MIQMVEDLSDHPRVFNTGNDLHPPATAPAGLDVDPKYALETLRLFQCSGMSGRSSLDLNREPLNIPD